ncbi:MAG: ACP S-malonyltransferase [Phycisphaerales bacterium JB037]
MSDPLVILCPGQGAQAVGMGAAWADASPEAAAVLARADEVVGDRFGAKLSEICRSGPGETLNRTDVSQPAIFAVSAASLAGLVAGWGATLTDLTISATAGLSLGEYTALYAAGAMDFEQALELVLLRGRAMQDAAEATPSGMVALIGDDEASAAKVCDAARGDGVLVAANFNAPGQVVISGSRDACERAVEVAGDHGLRATPLPVAGAFHSPLMQPAADRLGEALAKTPIREPRCAVLSNVTGQPHEGGADAIRAKLVAQLTSPVRWETNCRWLVAHARGTPHELAPGKTLAGLARRIERDWKVETHDGPDA